MIRSLEMKLCWMMVFVWVQVTAADSSWSNCPAVCKCKWDSGKKVAECINQSLTAVPDHLSSEIQSINLTKNNIVSLPSEAFRAVGLVNLHKISLRECGIQEVDGDAFKGLHILIELDLSHNRIHTIYPATFKDNVRLRMLFIHHNPITKLENGLFTNMTFLQKLDVSHCHLSHIGHQTFINVPYLQHLVLSDNNIAHIEMAVVETLDRLSSLELHSNPWRCDCHLKAFRDWTINKNLYAEPTSCAEPPHLANKLWTDIASNDFACKPQIIYPPPDGLYTNATIVEALGEEVTIGCKVTGEPQPDAYWVMNSRVISNNTKPGMHSDLRGNMNVMWSKHSSGMLFTATMLLIRGFKYSTS